MSEKLFIKKVNKVINREVYSFGTTGTMVGGVPDRYYEGPKRSLWIEFKYLKKDTLSFNGPKRISPLQIEWLTRCWNNKHHPLVCVGVGGNQGFFLETPTEWRMIWDSDLYKHRLLSIYDIGLAINRMCIGTR